MFDGVVVPLDFGGTSSNTVLQPFLHKRRHGAAIRTSWRAALATVFSWLRRSGERLRPSLYPLRDKYFIEKKNAPYESVYYCLSAVINATTMYPSMAFSRMCSSEATTTSKGLVTFRAVIMAAKGCPVGGVGPCIVGNGLQVDPYLTQ